MIIILYFITIYICYILISTTFITIYIYVIFLFQLAYIMYLKRIACLFSNFITICLVKHHKQFKIGSGAIK